MTLTVIPQFSSEVRDEPSRLCRLGNGIISANFSLDNLRKQFNEDGLAQMMNRSGIVIPIYLPYFTNIPDNHIVEIRQKEIDRYSTFQFDLQKLLEKIPTLSHEQELLRVLQDIDKSIRKLNELYNRVQEAQRGKNIPFLIGLIGAGLVSCLSPNIPASVLTPLKEVLPLVTWSSFTEYRDRKKKDVDPLKEKILEDEFYLMWRLQDIKHHRL